MEGGREGEKERRRERERKWAGPLGVLQTGSALQPAHVAFTNSLFSYANELGSFFPILSNSFRFFPILSDSFENVPELNFPDISR